MIISFSLVYLTPLVVSIIFWLYMRTSVLYIIYDDGLMKKKILNKVKIPRIIIISGIALGCIPILNIATLPIVIIAFIYMICENCFEFKDTKLNNFLGG